MGKISIAWRKQEGHSSRSSVEEHLSVKTVHWGTRQGGQGRAAMHRGLVGRKGEMKVGTMLSQDSKGNLKHFFFLF